jgi:hypothetical protein
MVELETWGTAIFPFGLSHSLFCLSLVAWHPQHADLGLWIIATPLVLALGGLIVWIVGTFLALPLEAYYERRDKKYEGWGPAQGGDW